MAAKGPAERADWLDAQLGIKTKGKTHTRLDAIRAEMEEQGLFD